MVTPYTAVGLIPTVRGIRSRADIASNIEHLEHLVKAAAWLSGLSLPVRLIAIPEGALQAFNDEVLDLDHVTFARECAIDIPGEETGGPRRDRPGIRRLHHGAGQGPPSRSCPTGSSMSASSSIPQGEVILRHYKVSPLFPVEHSVSPHDVYDWWIEKYGTTSTRSGRSPTPRSAGSAS